MPEVAKAQATVQVHRVGMGPNPECLLYPPLPIMLLVSHNLGLIPVYVVVMLMDMDRDTIIVCLCLALHFLRVLLVSRTYTYMLTVSTRVLVDHACLFVLRHSVIYSHQSMADHTNRFEDSINSQRLEGLTGPFNLFGEALHIWKVQVTFLVRMLFSYLLLLLLWLRVLCIMCTSTGPPSPTAPVLCHAPALWSPSSGSGGDLPRMLHYS